MERKVVRLLMFEEEYLDEEGIYENKHKIYTGSTTTRAYIQSLSNHRFLRFPITL